MTQEVTLSEALVEKWDTLLESQELPAIDSSYKKTVTAILLENEEKALAEAAPTNVAAGVAGYDPVLIGMVRRAVPQMIAFDVCGVQPMTSPTGLVFAMKSRYSAQNGAEALFNEANGGFAGTGSFSGQIGSSIISITTTSADATVTTASTAGLSVGAPVVATGVPVGATVASITDGTTFELSANATASATVTAQIGVGNYVGTAAGLATATGEGDITAKMAFSIEKISVEAKTHQLMTGYSVELAQDLRALHGLDAEGELSNILARELVAEQNRVVLRDLYTVAKAGSQRGVTTPGIFDLKIDSDGRWSNEKFKGLLFNIERDLNAIGLDIRLGKGNLMVCSADVASALAAAGVLDYAPAIQALGSLSNADFTQNTFAGVIGGGRVKVYIDPYATGDFYMVGYKGASAFEAGYFLCPYVPAQMLRATDPASFQPLMALKMRYGKTYNPLSGSNVFRSNGFYRISAVTNIGAEG